MRYDPTYILVLIGAVISMIASINVKRTFRKYSTKINTQGYTAEQVAGMILEYSGIDYVTIERIPGDLTDHYSPNENVLRLSDSVYGSQSVAAIGVAAHECGHAIQHKEEYGPLKLRAASVPMANFGSKLCWPIIILGLFLGITGLTQLGVILFTFVVFFQLITLPVEFDASKRALAVLQDRNILIGEERDGAKAVLSAAALTYVAALFTAILQLFRLILLTRGGRGRRSR